MVGYQPRFPNSLSRSRHPDQLRDVEHVWEERIPSRSPGGLCTAMPLSGQEVETMQVVYPVCCGIDVHQAQLTACLRRVDVDGHVTQEVREFGTTTSALLACLEWLTTQHCPVVAMESTGVYTPPGILPIVGGII